MKVYSEEIEFSSNEPREIIDMTNEVLEVVDKSDVKNGILIAQLPHATSMIALNENESGLRRDILEKLNEFAPVRAGYKHDRIDDNAHAHLKAAFMGSSRVLPIIDGRVIRGTWQNFLVIEQDGPRSRRRLVVTVFGE